MLKKLNFKNLLIIYFNLVVLILISVLIIFINLGVDPKKDPLIESKYLNDINLTITPFENKLKILWTVGKIAQIVEGLREFIVSEKDNIEQLNPNLKKRAERTLRTFTDIYRYSNRLFSEFITVDKDQKFLNKFVAGQKAKKAEFLKVSPVPVEIKNFIAKYQREFEEPSSREFIQFMILPPDLREFLVLVPLWDVDQFIGFVFLRGKLEENVKKLVFPITTEDNISNILVNEDMKVIDKKVRVLEKNQFKSSISDYFPEIPKDFISQDKSVYWDKNDNLFVKTKFISMFNGDKTWYAIQKVPKKILTAPLNSFKRKLITLSILLFVIISVLDFFVISKGFSPLRNIIQGLHGTTTIIKESSFDLNETSTSWAESSMETSSGIETIMISMEGFLNTFREIKEETQKADLLSKEGTNLANSIRIETEKLLDSIKEISKSSKTIEEINKIIGEISFQTNLLALNASVEAARAGEHGKSFAIVAESIRELADKTAQSTEEISRLTLEAWTKSQNSLKAANNNNEIVSEVINNLKQMRLVVENINNSILGQYDKIDPLKNGLSLVQNTVKSGASNAIKGNEVSQNLNSQVVKLMDIVKNLSETIVGKVD